jgi:ribonucleotide monophosphatase NagD (HAD superfamily)
VAGLRFDLTILQLSVAVRAVLQCNTLLAPNRDPMYPHSSGMFVGTGSIVATIETATGIKAEVMGKPEQPMVDEVLRRIPDATLVVGDQFAMDGELARKAGLAFAFVESGVDAQRRTSRHNTPVAHTSTNLATLVEALL